MKYVPLILIFIFFAAVILSVFKSDLIKIFVGGKIDENFDETDNQQHRITSALEAHNVKEIDFRTKMKK